MPKNIFYLKATFVVVSESIKPLEIDNIKHLKQLCRQRSMLRFLNILFLHSNEMIVFNYLCMAQCVHGNGTSVQNVNNIFWKLWIISRYFTLKSMFITCEITISGECKSHVNLWHLELWQDPWTRFIRMQRKPGFPVANCSIKMVNNLLVLVGELIPWFLLILETYWTWFLLYRSSNYLYVLCII